MLYGFQFEIGQHARLKTSSLWLLDYFKMKYLLDRIHFRGRNVDLGTSVI